jgi:hypothetical protein
MPSDPFDEVRADVAAAVTEAESTLRQWRARHEEPTSKRLLADLESIEIDLADMESAIESATLNPERFNISESALAERRKFVRATRSTVAAAREEVARGKAAVGKAKAQGAPAEERVGLLAASTPGGFIGGPASSSGAGSGPSRRQRDMEQGNVEVFGLHGSLQQVRHADFASLPSVRLSLPCTSAFRSHLPSVRLCLLCVLESQARAPSVSAGGN